MATSKINNNLKSEVMWVNTNISSMGETNIRCDTNKKYKFVIIKYRIYVNSSGGVYYVNAVYSPLFETNGATYDSHALTSVRYDGSTNYIVGRQTAFTFATNTLYVSLGYRQDTYKTYTTDNSVLVPYIIVGYY